MIPTINPYFLLSILRLLRSLLYTRKLKLEALKISPNPWPKSADMSLTPRLGFFPPHLCVSQSVGHAWHHPRDPVRTAAVHLRDKKSNAQKKHALASKSPGEMQNLRSCSRPPESESTF